MMTLDRPNDSVEEATGCVTMILHRIVECAEGRLRNNAYLALRNISCEFRAGTLTLRGCLPTYYLKQVAQSAVMEIAGIERIENQIEVTTSLRTAR